MSKVLLLKICPLWSTSHSRLGMNGFDLAVGLLPEISCPLGLAVLFLECSEGILELVVLPILAGSLRVRAVHKPF